MILTLLISTLNQSSPAHLPVPLMAVGTPVAEIDWDRDPIVRYQYCGEDNVFFEIDCGVVTRSGQELIIFDGEITRASFSAGHLWRRETPFGELSSGQDFRASLAIIGEHCAGHSLSVEEDHLLLAVWSCGAWDNDVTMRITFDGSYRASAIEERMPSP
jgi:hypothetical protein